MKWLCVAMVLLLGVLHVAARGQSSGDDEVLTNDSVIKLVQSGVGPNLIIKMIEQQPTDFRLGSTNVIQLKQKGVPQNVISAMLSKKSSHPAAGTPGPSSTGKPSAKPVAPNYVWTRVEKTDPITGKQTFAVMLDTPALAEDGGARQGSFEVTATCSSAATTLQVVFASDVTPAIGFKQNSESYIVPGGLAGALTMASHHQKPWTVTRVRVGDSVGKEVTSENDYTNASDIYFSAPRPTSPAADQDEAGLRALLQFASFIGPNKPAGDTEELFRADTLLLEMELENGVKALLALKPQNPAFQIFAERCRKLEPKRLSLESAGARGELRPPDRSATGSGGSSEPPRANVPAAPAPIPRFMVPAGAQLTMTVQEALDLNDVHASKMVHAVLTQPMQAAGQPSGSAQASYLPLAAGTEIFLRCGAAAGMGDRLNVRLELDHAVVRGTVIPLRSEVQTRQTSRGLSLPSRPINVGGIGSVRLPQSHTPLNPVVVRAKEQLSFSTSQMTYAPPGFKP